MKLPRRLELWTVHVIQLRRQSWQECYWLVVSSGYLPAKPNKGRQECKESVPRSTRVRRFRDLCAEEATPPEECRVQEHRHSRLRLQLSRVLEMLRKSGVAARASRWFAPPSWPLASTHPSSREQPAAEYSRVHCDIRVISSCLFGVIGIVNIRMPTARGNHINMVWTGWS